ncbi:META domain-containing protein [Tenacibaculum sp. M341]|uniref:META domain-containing protein n=1 Tax=Tenacibaculum sp. M341 TaxID=2530339 RepID=UPI00104E3FE6|nr:META domain-containing protein [Tenacibaculum sp. M341]TCI91818.1 META domain-containing protein [Tenacibaculum sp. M341]
MKNFYNLITLLLSLTFITLMVSCSENNEDVITDAQIFEGNWKVSFYLVDGKKIIKTDDNTWPDVNNGDVTIGFSLPGENGEGQISGRSVLNQFNGSYTLKENKSITFAVISTLALDPEWGSLFSIEEVNKYDYKNNQLILYHNDDDAIVLDRN